MLATPTLTPDVATTIASTGYAAAQQAAAAGGRLDQLDQLARMNPILISTFLMTLGALCGLGLVLFAFTYQLTRNRHVRMPRPATRRRLVLAVLHSIRPAEFAVWRRRNDPAADMPCAWGTTSAQGSEAWRPLDEDIPGVGRVEWDPRTLRTFAGAPDVLYRLAFHRWRYQQGRLSEFKTQRPMGARDSSETSDLPSGSPVRRSPSAGEA